MRELSQLPYPHRNTYRLLIDHKRKLCLQSFALSANIFYTDLDDFFSARDLVIIAPDIPTPTTKISITPSIN